MLFILNPERMPETIDIEFQGQDSMHIDTSGNLHVYTGLGEVIYPIPNAWYDSNYVSVSYTKTGNIVSFSTANYNGSDTLYMEISSFLPPPQSSASDNLLWSTYFGGMYDEKIFGSSTDVSGNFYVCGQTNSPNFPITKGNTNANLYNGEVFYAKFDSQHKLLHSTTIGGYKHDKANDLTLSDNNYVYLTGATKSPNFPVYYSGNKYHSNTGKGFILRIEKTTGVLDWSTKYGSSGNKSEFFKAITSGVGGNIYITGYTKNSNFPTLSLGGSNYFHGNTDPETGFILWFDNNCNLKWATRIGSHTSNTQPLDIEYFNRNLILCGVAEDSGVDTFFFVQDTITSFQNGGTYGGGNWDGFLFTIGPKGNAMFNIKWSTYLGGNNDDRLTALTVDPTGIIYTCGYSTSDSGLLTMNDISSQQSYYEPALKSINSNYNDGVIAKFKLNGTQLWTTYFGGKYDDYCTSIKHISDTSVIVIGNSNSEGGNYFGMKQYGNAYFQQYINSNNPGSAGVNDVFISMFSKRSEQQWTTLFGGWQGDYANTIALHDSFLYISGWTNSPEYPDSNLHSFPLRNPGFPAFMQYYFPSKSNAYMSGFITLFDLGIQFGTTGININNKIDKEVLLYPNPVSSNHFAYIIAPNVYKTKYINVYNIIGEKVDVQWEIESDKIIKMEIERLPSGIYYILSNVFIDNALSLLVIE